MCDPPAYDEFVQDRVTAAPLDILDLERVEAISFGANGVIEPSDVPAFTAGMLYGWVPSDLDGNPTEKTTATLISRYTSDVWRTIRNARAPSLPSLRGRPGGSSSPQDVGRFWDSSTQGFMHGTVQLAVALLYASADLVADLPVELGCRVSADQLRDYIASNLRLSYRAAGTEPCTPYSPPEIVNFGSSASVRSHRFIIVSTAPATGLEAEFRQPGERHGVVLCDSLLGHCALADLYFWWAWRLMSYARHCRSGVLSVNLAVVRYYERLANLAVRNALAEVLPVAGTLLHEMLHATRFFGGNHCRSWTHLVHKGCCTYLLDLLFQHRMRAHFGIPRPHNGYGDGDDTAEGRWNEADGSLSDARFTANDLCDDGRIEARHGGMEAGHRLEFLWEIDSRCARDRGVPSGTIVFPTG